MLSAFLFAAALIFPAYAQEFYEGEGAQCVKTCTIDCVVNCVVDNCAVQAQASQDTNAASWLHNLGKFDYFGSWSATPTPTTPTVNAYLYDTRKTSATDPRRQRLAIATASTSGNEVECMIRQDTGALFCWGNYSMALINPTLPTGGQPYSDLAVGNVASAPIFGVLDSTGHPLVFGHATGATIDIAKPTSGGWDSIAIGLGPVGCVADEAGAGVTCWGWNVNSIVSGAPTTGQYQSLAIGQYNAIAVEKGSSPGVGGALTMWGASTAGATSFRNTWPGASDVLEVSVDETSTQRGVAWHQDHTITIWQDSNQAQERSIKSAPCGGTGAGKCPGSAAKSWHSATRFRTLPQLDRNGTGRICGVVENDPHGVYSCGQVICWGGPNDNAPVSRNTCDDPLNLCE